MTRAFVGISALVVALLAVGPEAHAQRRGRHDPARDEALELFRQSGVEYQAGRFAQAAALLERAWARFEEPILQYNLGRAWEGAGEPAKAIEAYRRYLTAAPRADDRASVESKIAELQRQVQERTETERRQAEEDARNRRTADADDRRAVERDERERRRRLNGEEDHGDDIGGGGPGLAPWILVGAGGVTLGAGALFGLLASSKHDDAVSDRVQQSARDKQDGAETFATLANVSFVLGAVAAAGGATWIILGGRADAEAGGDDDDEAEPEDAAEPEEPEEEEEENEDDEWVAERDAALRVSFGPGSVLVEGRFP